MPVYNSGIKTDRDSLFIGKNKDELSKRIKKLLSNDYNNTFIEKYRVKNSDSSFGSEIFWYCSNFLSTID